MYAAIGDDGFREVVWGVGETEKAAREDAVRWIGEAHGAHADTDGLDVVEITAEQAERIRAGEVSWKTLQEMHQHTVCREMGRYGFTGPVASKEHQDKRAHGGVRIVECCACGAKRDRLVNGRHEEIGNWCKEVTG